MIGANAASAKANAAGEGAGASEVRAERLILMAAGLGSRLAPITNVTPKPLVRVNGRRMVDGTIQAALDAGIRDIVVVRGYKAQAFDVLAQDYPQVRFVENPDYATANNILSVLLVRDLLANAYLAEADLVLSNPALITPTQHQSNYIGVPCAHTDDWAFATQATPQGRRIERVLPQGGDNVCHMFGISFWLEHDARLLAHELPQAIAAPGGRELYFEDVVLGKYGSNHEVYVRECSFNDIVEIDTVQDLVAADPSWADAC